MPMSALSYPRFTLYLVYMINKEWITWRIKWILCRPQLTASDNNLVPLLLSTLLRSGFSTWSPPPSSPCSTWDALARFLVFIWQHGTTSDVGKLLGSFLIALGGFSPSLGVQLRAGGAVTLFPCVTTLGRAHYTIGHITRPTSHIKFAIAHRHRDLHACMQSRMENRVFWWRRSTNAHAIRPGPRRATSKPIPTPKPFKWSMGVGIITQHSRKPQKSVVFQPNSL